MAILFDASGSMNGLLSQAKSRIWTIVNELSTYSVGGQTPTLEIALYEYGKTTHSIARNYVHQLTDFTSDLDRISSLLFAITTNGGNEYCGAVIDYSGKELKWSDNQRDLKMIYIAGNEPFDQGPVDFTKIIPPLRKREIYVNTIYCGPHEQGVRELWQNGAALGGGSYFNIDHNQKIQTISTPYDDPINAYNDSLNRTYIGYGDKGQAYKSRQIAEDQNAETISLSNKAERAAAKSSKHYSNSHWDIVDAVEEGKVDLAEMPAAALPDTMRQMNVEQQKEFLLEKNQEREKYQTQIQELSTKRQQFILEKRKEQENTGSDDFGSSVNKSIEEKALEKGYVKKTL